MPTDIKKLPAPRKGMDFPLMKALEMRRTARKWREDAISDQELSDILWCACGITKDEGGTGKSRRTAPSACNSQEIRVYAATRDGLFLYEEEGHRLVRLAATDIRGSFGTQKMMHSAPLGLIYVCDRARMNSPILEDEGLRAFCSAADTGFVSQNVYLCCTALGLSTVVFGLIDREKLKKEMGLKEHEEITLAQAIGHAP